MLVPLVSIRGQSLETTEQFKKNSQDLERSGVKPVLDASAKQLKGLLEMMLEPSDATVLGYPKED